MNSHLYQKTLSIVKHRLATRRDIKGIEERDGLIIEKTRTGENLWIPVEDIEKYKEYIDKKKEKLFIAISYYNGLVEDILRIMNGSPKELNIVIFIDNDIKMVNPYLLSRYPDPEKALRTILLENGA
ncbi:hypothetical protein J7K74_01930 [Candidatus Woesearchaeota archaeon]|nr:hypothetical protein [Candidatus Woesearchaeota archaeon]